MTKKSDENIINIINETHNFDRKYHNIKVGLYKVEEKYEDSITEDMFTLFGIC